MKISCSYRKRAKTTPEGKWVINNKVVNPAWKNIKGGVPENPLGYRWMGLNIGDGYIYEFTAQIMKEALDTLFQKDVLEWIIMMLTNYLL